jgi:multidrug resistance efflux pump
MNKWLPWLASAALVAVGGGAVYMTTVGLDDTQAATVDYITQAATRSDVTVTSAASGSVAAATSYSLAFGAEPSIGSETTAASDQSWTVTDVLVNVGDGVTAGQTLAVAEAVDLESQIATVEADLERAQLTLSDAETTLAAAPAETRASILGLDAKLMTLKMQLANAREMRDDAASGSDEKRTARINIIDTKLQIEAARDERAQLRAERKAGYPSLAVAVTEAGQSVADMQQQLADLQQQLELATIIAPVDGVVSSLDITAGYTAPSGAAIVLDSDTLEVVASVVESDINSLVMGQPANVTIEALDQDVAGVVTSVVPTTTAGTSSVVSYPVTVTLTDPGAGVLAGMVDAVDRGDDAIDQLRWYEYDVAVLDWCMPGLEGIEVVRWARRHGRPTAVLMLTARDATTDRVEGLDAGADDYLVKPFEFSELLARIRALQRRPRGVDSPIGAGRLDRPAHRRLARQRLQVRPCRGPCGGHRGGSRPACLARGGRRWTRHPQGPARARLRPLRSRIRRGPRHGPGTGHRRRHRAGYRRALAHRGLTTGWGARGRRLAGGGLARR